MWSIDHPPTPLGEQPAEGVPAPRAVEDDQEGAPAKSPSIAPAPSELAEDRRSVAESGRRQGGGVQGGRAGANRTHSLRRPSPDRPRTQCAATTLHSRHLMQSRKSCPCLLVPSTRASGCVRARAAHVRGVRAREGWLRARAGRVCEAGGWVHGALGAAGGRRTCVFRCARGRTVEIAERPAARDAIPVPIFMFDPVSAFSARLSCVEG